MKSVPFPKYGQMGKRIRLLREHLGVTQEKASNMLGISGSFYGHIERGTRKPSIETICKIASTFNESTDYILGDFLERDGETPSLGLRSSLHHLNEATIGIQRYITESMDGDAGESGVKSKINGNARRNRG